MSAQSESAAVPSASAEKPERFLLSVSDAHADGAAMVPHELGGWVRYCDWKNKPALINIPGRSLASDGPTAEWSLGYNDALDDVRDLNETVTLTPAQMQARQHKGAAECLPSEISRELMGIIVDQVFDGAIEDSSVISDIYRVIATHFQAGRPVTGEPIYQWRPSHDDEWGEVNKADFDWAGQVGHERRILWTTPPAAVHGHEAVRDVLAERERQVTEERWSVEHDDSHEDGQLADAAGCYALWAAGYSLNGWREFWPWKPEWLKQDEPRRMLVKAGALVLAEIQRLDRATPPAQDAGHE